MSEGVTPIEEPGGQPGEGAASSAEGSNGSPSIEKLTEQLAELAARNETVWTDEPRWSWRCEAVYARYS